MFSTLQQSRLSARLYWYSHPLQDSLSETPLSSSGLQTFWHSSAHLLGQALELEYGADLTIGPALEEGFYYDCYLGDRTLTEADKGKVEKRIDAVSGARGEQVHTDAFGININSNALKQGLAHCAMHNMQSQKHSDCAFLTVWGRVAQTQFLLVPKTGFKHQIHVYSHCTASITIELNHVQPCTIHKLERPWV